MDTPCPRCLHFHDIYARFRSADSIEKDAVVFCFRCPLCGAHFSVIPEGMMPYRPLPVDDAQRYGDQQSRFDGTPTPLAAEDTDYFFPKAAAV
jgi:hypothetical protein